MRVEERKAPSEPRSFTELIARTKQRRLRAVIQGLAMADFHHRGRRDRTGFDKNHERPIHFRIRYILSELLLRDLRVLRG